MLFLKICGAVILGALTILIVYIVIYAIAETAEMRKEKRKYHINALIDDEWVFLGTCSDVKSLAASCFNMGKREDITKIHVRVVQNNERK